MVRVRRLWPTVRPEVSPQGSPSDPHRRKRQRRSLGLLGAPRPPPLGPALLPVWKKSHNWNQLGSVSSPARLDLQGPAGPQPGSVTLTQRSEETGTATLDGGFYFETQQEVGVGFDKPLMQVLFRGRLGVSGPTPGRRPRWSPHVDPQEEVRGAGNVQDGRP